ncbi:MAG: hypothetical protein JWO09_1481 [Bacteroidetes bacterium]|nr:hypothetical protein [Bacteroidota bacterium]
MEKQKIYTIGHSTRSFEELVLMLQSFGIKVLVDIRNYPGSRMFSHFNKEYLEEALPQNGIKYVHLKELGGRRKPLPDSRNTAWRVAAFRGYADYMETSPFKEAIKQLEKLGKKAPVAYMCSEALWWSCHRALVSDYLKFRGWNVIHIMDKGKGTPHTYTSPARIINDRLAYGIE